MKFLKTVSNGRLPRVCAALAAATAIVSLAACAASPTTPDPGDPSPAQVNYTAVGASDAIGIGASISCLPFIACPSGTGYVQVLGRNLAEGGKTVDLLNLGIPGAVLSPRIQTISNSYGPRVDTNFLERELPFVRSDAEIVTIFAGGNDTNVVARSVSGSSNGNPRAYVDDQVEKFATDMRTLVSGIRSRAPSARIVIANLPNFSGAPFTKKYTLDQRRALQQISVGFSTEGINPLASMSNVAVVDLLCEDRFYVSSSYSSDGFHPSDAGYAIMAEKMLTAIRSSSYPAPRASCGRMNLVPSL
jgi:lysophospholipase L1-like esterase